MRILVTKSGENIFTEEEKEEIREKKFRSTTTSKAFKRKLTLEKSKPKKLNLAINTSDNFFDRNKINFNRTNYKNFMQKGNQGINPSNFLKTSNTFYPQNIKISAQNAKESLKKINLKVPKITFPKELENKYDIFKPVIKENDDDLEYEQELPKVDKFSRPGYKFSLGEIIDGKVIYKLKKSIVAEEKMKEKLSVIDSSNFRTNYAWTSKLIKLNEILNYKKIKSDKAELIKYLNTHKNLSSLFLKNIVTSDIHGLEKYDKMSQTLLFNKDMDEKFRFELEQKVKAKSNFKKESGTNNLHFMNSKIKKEEEILEKYKNKADRKLNYLEKHKEIKKDWVKFGLKHLASKSYIPRKINLYRNVKSIPNSP